MPDIPETDEAKDIRLHKDLAAFSYIWIMSLMVYAMKKDSKFLEFHSKQGIVLFLLSIPVWFLPFIGRFLTLILVGGMVLGFINAAQGLKRDVPLIGKLSRGELKSSDLKEVWKALKETFTGLSSFFATSGSSSTAKAESTSQEQERLDKTISGPLP